MRAACECQGCAVCWYGPNDHCECRREHVGRFEQWKESRLLCKPCSVITHAQVELAKEMGQAMARRADDLLWGEVAK